MKKLILGLLIAVGGAFGANAQVLWQVSGNGSKGTSYLLGTHHLAPLSMLDSISGFAPALDAVDAVVGEIDMSAMTANAQSLMGYMLAPADSLLTTVLTPAQTDSLNLLLNKYMGPQMTAAQFAPLKPAALTTQLALIESMATMAPEQAQALAAGIQLDTEVQNRALAAQKAIMAFETPEQQMALLMGAPITDQAAQLMEAVRQSLSGKSAEQARKLTDAYMAQDLNAIAELIFDPEAMESGDIQRLILDRNVDWVAQLASIMPEKSVIVAVGAGHLPGPQGLIELLRNAGFTVTPASAL